MTEHRWNTSKRRKTETQEFKLNRGLAIERDNGRCQALMRDGTQCKDAGTQCDHIISLANGGTDALDNLQMLCSWHHNKKTSQEGRDARKTVSMYRPKEAHPGLIS
jgi:5-methylcytosine-specific restriction protein A